MNSKQILLILSLTLAIFLIPKPTHAAITTFQILAPINGEQTLNTTLPLKLFLISTNATYITCNLSLYRWDGTFLYNMTLNVTNATVYSDNLSLSPDDYYFYLTCNDTNSSFTTKGPIKIGFGNTIYQWGMILEDPGQYKLGRDIFVPTKLAPTWFGYSSTFYVMAYHGVLVYPLNQTYVKLMSHVWYNGKPYNYTIYPVFPIHYMFDPEIHDDRIIDIYNNHIAMNITYWSYISNLGSFWPPLLMPLIPAKHGINETNAGNGIWWPAPGPPYISFANPIPGYGQEGGYIYFIAPPWIIRTNKGIIMKSNEQLDCQGYEIYSNHKFYSGNYGEFYSSIGIDIEGNNVSIQNCVFKNIYHAIIDYNDTKTYTVNYTINIPQLSKKFPFLPLKMTLPYRLVNISLFNIKLYNSSIVNPYGIINATDIYADHSYIFNLNKVNNSAFIDSEIATAAFPFAIYQNSNFTGTEISNKNSYIPIASNANEQFSFVSPMGYLPHYPTIYFIHDILARDTFTSICDKGGCGIEASLPFIPLTMIYNTTIDNSTAKYVITVAYDDKIINEYPCKPFSVWVLNDTVNKSCIVSSMVDNSSIHYSHIYNPYHVFYSKLYNSNIVINSYPNEYNVAGATLQYPPGTHKQIGYYWPDGMKFNIFANVSNVLPHMQNQVPVIIHYLLGNEFIAKKTTTHFITKLNMSFINGAYSVESIETHVPVIGVNAQINNIILNTTHQIYTRIISITNNTYVPSTRWTIAHNIIVINDSAFLPAIATRVSPFTSPTISTNFLLIGNKTMYKINHIVVVPNPYWEVPEGDLSDYLHSVPYAIVKELANQHLAAVENNKIIVENTSNFDSGHNIVSMQYISNNTMHSCIMFSSDLFDFSIFENVTLQGDLGILKYPNTLLMLMADGRSDPNSIKPTHSTIDRVYINPHNPKDYSVNVLIANNQINATNVKYGLCYYLDAGTYTTHNSIYGPDYAVLLNMTYPEYFTYNIFDAKDKDIYIDKNQYDIHIRLYMIPIESLPIPSAAPPLATTFLLLTHPVTITTGGEIPITIFSPIVATVSTPSYQINQWNITTYGNYYLLLNGKGYSQICTDNNHDKRCDQKYVILDPPTIVNIDYYPLWWPHQTLYSIGVPGPGPLIQLTNTSTHPKANLIVKPTELYFYIPNATECQTKTINIEWLGNTQGQISIGKDIQGEYLIWEPTDTFSQLVQPNTLIKLNIQVCSPTNYNTYPKETNATLFIYGTYQSGTLTKKVIIHLIKSKQPHHKKKKPITMPSPVPTSASWFNKLITYALWIILIFAALLLIKAIAHKHAAHKLAYY